MSRACSRPLTDDVEHDIVGWPGGPAHDHDAGARLLRDPVRRPRRRPRHLASAGSTAMISWSTIASGGAGRRAARSASRARGRPLEFRLLHVLEFSEAGDIRRENVWIDLAAIQRQLPQADGVSDGAGAQPEEPHPQGPAARRGAADAGRAAARPSRRWPRRRWSRAPPPIAISRASRRCWSRRRSTSRCRRPEALFEGETAEDPVDAAAREVDARDAATMIRANEPALRADADPQRCSRASARPADAVPAAAEPAHPADRGGARRPPRFAPGRADRLAKALALVIGTEAMLAFKDVLGSPTTRRTRSARWMIRALVEAAAKA